MRNIDCNTLGILFFVFFTDFASSSSNLQMGMPHVCEEEAVRVVRSVQPCVKSFTRLVKVWKQSCENKRWCVGYERRTAYYTTYKTSYETKRSTKSKCCPGWAQINGEAGCNHRELNTYSSLLLDCFQIINVKAKFKVLCPIDKHWLLKLLNKKFKRNFK